jgi:hypothetical protein
VRGSGSVRKGLGSSGRGLRGSRTVGRRLNVLGISRVLKGKRGGKYGKGCHNPILGYSPKFIFFQNKNKKIK